MLKRFAVAFVTFVALIVPGAFMAALLVSPAKPAPLARPDCPHSLAGAGSLAVQARLQRLQPHADTCNATRLYFLELVKARAVTAVCIQGPDRDRELGRLDADVARANNAIAANCN